MPKIKFFKYLKSIPLLFQALRASKRGKLILYASGAALVLIAAVILAVSVNSDRVGTALDSKSKNYERVQVKVTQSLENLSDDSSYTSDYTESTQTGIYDSDTGNQSASPSVSSTEPEEISVMKKDGNVYYEEGLSGKCYYYSRSNKNYVMYYDDFYGINADNGKWTEVSADNYNLAPSFDFSVLDKVKSSELKKKNGYYIPKKQDSTLFYDLLGIKNKDYYSEYDIKLYIEKGKLKKIETEYVFNYSAAGSEIGTVTSFKAKQNYEFTYYDEKITVPKADVTNAE